MRALSLIAIATAVVAIGGTTPAAATPVHTTVTFGVTPGA